jgi:hypothetical protein
MQGKIVRISLTYQLDAVEDGAKYRFIGDQALERHMRPERFEELMQDLTMGAEQVLAGRHDSDQQADRPLKVIR